MRFRWLLSIITFLFVNHTNAQLTYKQLRVDYNSAWTYKNLQLIPIRFKGEQDKSSSSSSSTPHPITLAQAMELHKIKVQEMQFEQGADVNWLQVTNHSKEPILIQSGEILEGGKQDRMVGETKFIAPGATDYIHVFCIEKRRWNGKPRAFTYQGMVNSKVRRAMDETNRQADVWKVIDKQFEDAKKPSETFAYLDLYKDAAVTDTGYLNFFRTRYAQAGGNLAGFIFISGGNILSTEIFASPDLLDMSFINMLSSYIQTVQQNGAPPKVNVAIIKAFMDKVLMNEDAQRAYLNTHGKVHRFDNKTLHLIAYPAN